MSAYWQLGSLLILLGIVPGGSALSNNMTGLVSASAIAFIFFVICIIIGSIYYNCDSFYRNMGYVKIPKRIREMRRRQHKMMVMDNYSHSQQYLTPKHVPEQDVSWVEQWSDNAREERQDAVMQLGPEGPEAEYRIETSLVDNEPLDLGPFRPHQANGDIPQPDALYSVVDKSQVELQVSSSSTNGTNVNETTILL